MRRPDAKLMPRDRSKTCMKAMGAVWRLLRGLGHLLVGLWIIQTRFHRLSPAHQQAHVQIWSLELLALWRIRIEVRGDPVTSGPALLVANHISWLDIVVMHAARYCRFVSKADVKDWPVVGALATGAGTRTCSANHAATPCGWYTTWLMPCARAKSWRFFPRAPPATDFTCCHFMPT